MTQNNVSITQIARNRIKYLLEKAISHSQIIYDMNTWNMSNNVSITQIATNRIKYLLKKLISRSQTIYDMNTWNM